MLKSFLSGPCCTWSLYRLRKSHTASIAFVSMKNARPGHDSTEILDIDASPNSLPSIRL